MLFIHRFPLILQNAIGEIIDSWNIKLVIPLKDDTIISDAIPISNGILQGDTISGDLYTLSTNPVSWELRRYDGYKLSKPIIESVSHSLFMDDLKTYSKSSKEMCNMLSEVKEKMHDAGLNWNNKKCKAIEIRRGKLDTSQKELVLLDGTKVEYLQSEQDYKFLGVPENNLHNFENIIESLTKLIRQRTNVIWSSPLSDFNKVMATNIFVYSSMEYYMWSERFNLTDIRELDKIIREVMNQYHAKYSLQMNATLYLPRQKGGRGLRNLEMVYKKTKIKTMMNLFESTDPRIKCVKRFHMERMNKGKSSIINDAVKFAKEDFHVDFTPLDDSFTFTYTNENDDDIPTTDIVVVDKVLKLISRKKVTK